MQFTTYAITEYDMVSIIQTKDKKGTLLNLPDYIHDHVKVKKLEGKGRGVIATEDISPGELIIAAKALAIVFPEQCCESSVLKRDVQKMGLLREKLAQALTNHPQLVPKVYNLHAGPQLEYLENAAVNMPVDKARIERICALNGFEGDGGSYGLWHFPSFLNHTCHESNAHWRIFKNMMFVRAAKPIAKGEEILISYVDPNRPYSDRRKLFIKHDFFCHCKLCELEKKEGKEIRSQRDRILEDFMNPKSGISCQEIIKALQSLRPDYPDLNVFLIGPLLELGLSFYEVQEYEKAAKAFEQCFNLCATSSAQFSLVQVSCALTIATCHLRQISPGSASAVQHWVDISKTCIRTQYGGFNSTVDLLNCIRPNFVEEMKSAGYNLE